MCIVFGNMTCDILSHIIDAHNFILFFYKEEKKSCNNQYSRIATLVESKYRSVSSLLDYLLPFGFNINVPQKCVKNDPWS